jgi:hypothetical protein
MKSVRIAALMLLAATAPALAQMLVATQSHEALPQMVHLPDSVDGELALQVCDACKVLRLRASAASRYFVGEQEVSLVEFRTYVDQHPNAPMVVVQPPDSLTLMSVRVSSTTRAR